MALIENSDYFNQTLLDCVVDGVTAILGHQVLESLFVRLETYQGLARNEIPLHLDTFFAALEKAFGPPSGKTIGRFIIKLLYARLGLEFDCKSNRVLVDYVADAMTKLGRKN
jgi:hypothetical protein